MDVLWLEYGQCGVEDGKIVVDEKVMLMWMWKGWVSCYVNTRRRYTAALRIPAPPIFVTQKAFAESADADF